jgi:hypothetical protein
MMSDAIGQSIQQGADLAGLRVIGGFERILVQFALSELVHEPCTASEHSHADDLPQTKNGHVRQGSRLEQRDGECHRCREAIAEAFLTPGDWVRQERFPGNDCVFFRRANRVFVLLWRV